MIYIATSVYNTMQEAFSTHTPECGGVLGAIPGNIITNFYFDHDGIGTPDSYTPNHIAINRLLENEWAENEIRMVGMVHSHGNTGEFPSCGDLHYCEQIMRSAGLNCFLLPIVVLNPFKLCVYKVQLKNDRVNVLKEEFELV